ncbi:hypothetical protein GGR35_001850 [Mucilaginibacter phyllosphaerae]|uniref:Uncharacterized protein n=1 Tax=Mucilaginibacter phyllosphaerae TaxID=1812349 RepID=A0ABR6I8E7_9SPHI|nr:hypothetical protein [Mucilaginibacter phyllosphaerae]
MPAPLLYQNEGLMFKGELLIFNHDNYPAPYNAFAICNYIYGM